MPTNTADIATGRWKNKKYTNNTIIYLLKVKHVTEEILCLV